MNALLELENAGLDYVDIFAEKISRETIFRFFYSGLVEKAGKLRAAEIFKAAGALKVWEKCIEAVLLALPEPDPLLIPNTKQHENNGIDYAALRCFVCDIMRKPEDFFWSSTLRELFLRWEKFAVFKGYIKPPERMELYDTEGMD